MSLKKLDKSINFRVVDITFQAQHYVCPVCSIEVGTIHQTAITQKAISDAYRYGLTQLSRSI